MGINIVVLAKQVPDTRNVGKEAMKADGTVNRAALPAIFNPEDLNALEMALTVKDRLPGSVVTVVTMGPARAADVIREALYRGADAGILVTDKKFAGSDTLATSYALSLVVKKLGNVDLVFAGRQAIDGDTAQVGPQTAEKLGLPQITYAEELAALSATSITVKRRLERGVEWVEAPFPCLLTVNGSAPVCRPRRAKRVMKYKKAMTVSEQQEATQDYTALLSAKPYLKIEEWGAADVGADMARLGLSGSPTKVKKIDNVILAPKESVALTAAESDLERLVDEWVKNHLFG